MNAEVSVKHCHWPDLFGFGILSLVGLGCGEVDQGSQAAGQNTANDAGETADAFTSRTVTAVSAGTRHLCAVADGAAYCWGDNSWGQLGNDSETSSAVPVQVQGLSSGVRAVSAGGQHSCAVVDGAAYCWGDNFYMELGNDSTSSSLVPVLVTGLGSGVEAIAAGLDHTCAVVDGAAYCWGDNGQGALGNSSVTYSQVPIPVEGLGSGVQALSAGASHTCAVVNAAAYCWGSPFTTSADRAAPVQVPGANSGVEAISGGYEYTCAVVDGGARCWGKNDFGQLGDDSVTDSLLDPVQVQGLTSGVTLIAAGSWHSCAVMNGTVYCWGMNSCGQLGSAAPTSYCGGFGNIPCNLVPVQVPGLGSGATMLAANGDYWGSSTGGWSCAVLAGAAYCWGEGSGGPGGVICEPTSLFLPRQVQFP
jgi:alpha-tubulin suppressor-like RCC1 family protein